MTLEKLLAGIKIDSSAWGQHALCSNLHLLFRERGDPFGDLPACPPLPIGPGLLNSLCFLPALAVCLLFLPTHVYCSMGYFHSVTSTLPKCQGGHRYALNGLPIHYWGVGNEMGTVPRALFLALGESETF